MLITTALEYFKYFSEKNLHALESIYAENVKLRDWEITTQGRSKVLEANKKTFKDLDNLQIKVLETYEKGQTVVVELELLLNKDNSLLIVDVITFNEDNKIINIRAYKGS
jgi:hypothetical protein